MTNLHKYFARLQSTILSRREIEVEELTVEMYPESEVPEGEFYALLRFYDGSRLYVVETE